MQAVMSLASQVFVLAEGRMIAMGTAAGDRGGPARHRSLSRSRRSRAHAGGGRWLSCSRSPGLHAGYGATEILRGIDLAVHEREIVAVLGSNGAGKSTLNRAVSGVLRPWRGAISLPGPGDRARASLRDRGARPDPRAGRPPHLSQHDGRARTSISAAIAARGGTARRTASASTGSFRASPSGSARAPERSPAASSRCWRSGAA